MIKKIIKNNIDFKDENSSQKFKILNKIKNINI